MAAPAAGGGHLRTDGESLEFVNKSEGHHEINAECAAVFEQLKIRRKHRYIVYRIGEKEIEVETIGERGASYEDFKSKLPFTDSRYAIYDQEYKTHDGRLTSKLWFVSWLPNNSPPYNKMAYTSAKGKFREKLPGVFDTQASSTDELDTNLGMKAVEEEEDNEFDD